MSWSTPPTDRRPPEVRRSRSDRPPGALGTFKSQGSQLSQVDDYEVTQNAQNWFEG